MQVYFTYRKDVDELEQRSTASQVNINDPHYKVNAEYLTNKRKVGLETTRDNFNATTQQDVQTSMEPLSRQVRVDNLDLHLKRLKGA